MLLVSPISRARRAPDSGSALMAVVGVMAVTMMLAFTAVGVTVSAVSVSVSSRAAVQADAAAAAGVDVTRASLQRTTGCTAPGTYASAATPTYTAQVFWSADGTSVPSPTWTQGCPGATAAQIKIVSQGTAANKGIAGDSSSDTHRTEAVYNYTPAATTPTAGGSLVYAFAGGNNLNSLTTLRGGTEPASTVFKTVDGVLTCQNSTVNGDVVIENGSFSGAGGCVINGNVSVGGTVALNSGATVTGNVTAAGNVTTANLISGQYVVAMENGPSTRIGGNLVSQGPVRIGGTVNKNVTAGPGLGTSIFPASGRVDGAITVSGGVSADGASRCAPPLNLTNNASEACAIKKALRAPAEPVYGQAGLPTPAAPSAPSWVNYTYKASDWTALGFITVSWSGDRCNNGNWNSSFLTDLANSGIKTVVDARACTEFLLQPGTTIKFKADVAFIAPKFGFGPGTYDSFDSAQRQLWFISPGSPSTTVPTCPVGDCGMNIYGAITLTSKVTALAYTPGTIDNNQTNWRGQLYGKKVNFGGGISTTFVPIPLPGAELGGGAAGGGARPGIGSVGSLISERTLAVGG